MEYTFTGQMSYMDDPITSETTEGFGLMFFNARWLDPAIGRFAQADTIIPPGVQGLDRYAYANNSPLVYTDPNGHCPVWGVLLMGTVWCGEQAGGLGIMRSILWAGDTRVAAALSVQSQWLAPWDFHIAEPILVAMGRNSSGFGIGQITDKEMEDFQLEGSQDLPWNSAKAMQMRIDKVIGVCENYTCSAEDKLIATALAQNGSGFTRVAFESLLRNAEGKSVQWESYFDAREMSGGDGGVLDFRAEGYGDGRGGFDTRFMLRLYINDMLALNRLGWGLPYGLTRKQLSDIRDRYAARK
jgi:RHS repeat-associated protein